MNEGGVISGVSVSHVDADVDEIESACGDDERGVVTDLLSREGVEEAFAIQTCNRAEAYVVTDDDADGRAALSDFAPEVRDGAVAETDHEASIRHLMRVAAGLESLVLGEDQILGQLKEAFSEARAVGGVGPTLDEAVTKAVHVGERVRTETGINEGVVSLGSAAVELAGRELDLTDATALVVGAGEMGTLTARALAGTDVEHIVVANRTVPHAEHVASEVGVDASAVGIDAASAAATTADLVVTATGSPSYVLDRDALAGAGETVLVDLARPRDVDPAASKLTDVTVYDLDALEAVTEDTRARRRSEVDRVESMIDDEFGRLMDSYKRKRADEAVSAMYENAEALKRREVETALSKLEAQGELNERQRESVEALADALVGKLLAAPTKSLREAAAEDDWNTIQTAMRLFDPDFGGGPPDVAGTDGPREGSGDESPSGGGFEESLDD